MRPSSSRMHARLIKSPQEAATSKSDNHKWRLTRQPKQPRTTNCFVYELFRAQYWITVPNQYPKYTTPCIRSLQFYQLRIDLKWREMRSKVIFGHPKRPFCGKISHFSPLFRHFFQIIPTFPQFSPFLQLFQLFPNFSQFFSTFPHFSPLFPTFPHFSLLFNTFHHFSPLFATFHYFFATFTTFSNSSPIFGVFHHFSLLFLAFPHFSPPFTTFHHF